MDALTIITIALVLVIGWALAIVTWMLRSREVTAQRTLDVAIGLVDKQALMMAASVDRARRDKSPVRVNAAGNGRMSQAKRMHVTEQQRQFDSAYESGQVTPDSMKAMTEEFDARRIDSAE